MQKNNRRYDLDWWRVIAILAVFLHHVGMPFNGDDFHIMNAESSKALDDITVFFEQIRLPLLFLISGTGTVFAFSKRKWFQFIGERSYRLLIPLFFGVVLIVPPQIYFENIQEYSSYFQLYPDALLHLKTNHLWFIENLFYISIISIPIIILFKSKQSIGVKKLLDEIASRKYGLFLWVLPLLFIKIVSKDFYPSDSKDITNLSSTFFFGYFFLTGILMTTTPNIWNHLKRHRKFNLRIAIACIIIFYGYYFLPEEIASKVFSLKVRWIIWYLVTCLVSWSSIITLLGYGQFWFNKSSPLLTKLNEAIYPFYILHQTVIVVLTFYIVKLNLPIFIKIPILLKSSLLIIIILYRFLIYPFKLTRIIFGMKKNE
ncbi:acyltransferase [uncultured Croceitalea sp.]|uniref:acyltransferase n=1 Tax=uncultured Croceitalea sp. TaxID=1798908 RepID=UPI0033063EC9